MGRRAHPDHPLRPQVPQPEPDQELLAELCRLPPLPEDQGRKITKFQFLKFRNLVNTYLVFIYLVFSKYIFFKQILGEKQNPGQGEEYEPCEFFKKNFTTVCPNAWVEKWNVQREKVLMMMMILL